MEAGRIAAVHPRRHAWVMPSLFTWRGTDDPERIDHASVCFSHTSMTAHGVSLTPSYASSWQLDIGSGWATRSLRVNIQGHNWGRCLVLTRDDSGGWSADTTDWGDVDLPAPGLAEPESLQDAIDCDLGLCPLTNTMPIRRLGLLEKDVPDTALVMAWVDVPSLRVVRSDQVYASGTAVIPGAVRYASLNGDFTAELTVDNNGVVVDYPHLARRVQIPS